MQRSVNRSPMGRPDWSQLPSELLTEVFKGLSKPDLVRAELCCRSWNQTLKCLQGCKLWGDVCVELDVIIDAVSGQSREKPSNTQRFLPTCRWFVSHAAGIESLQIQTLCAEADLTEVDIGLVRGLFAMLMASLSGLQVDVHLHLTSEESEWQLGNQPMLRNALAENLVSLSLPQGLDHEGCALPTPGGHEEFCRGLGLLTGLTELDLYSIGPVAFEAAHLGWDPESLYALMRGRLLLDKVPACKVQFTDS
ncbi:hypothetical protein WJX73_010373 [Symbiochloris irregularis]|uniref:F-box domain-containing protein n=1 Tax=Symbiochloris irregularis TaxID=706552 RepID=A0AAW1NXJ3_9CHLO